MPSPFIRGALVACMSAISLAVAEDPPTAVPRFDHNPPPLVYSIRAELHPDSAVIAGTMDMEFRFALWDSTRDSFFLDWSSQTTIDSILLNGVPVGMRDAEVASGRAGKGRYLSLYLPLPNIAPITSLITVLFSTRLARKGLTKPQIIREWYPEIYWQHAASGYREMSAALKSKLARSTQFSVVVSAPSEYELLGAGELINDAELYGRYRLSDSAGASAIDVVRQNQRTDMTTGGPQTFQTRYWVAKDIDRYWLLWGRSLTFDRWRLPGHAVLDFWYDRSKGAKDAAKLRSKITAAIDSLVRTFPRPVNQHIPLVRLGIPSKITAGWPGLIDTRNRRWPDSLVHYWLGDTAQTPE
jgi:hypothetical protein